MLQSVRVADPVELMRVDRGLVSQNSRNLVEITTMYATYYVSQRPLFQLADLIAQNFHRARNHAHRSPVGSCAAPRPASQDVASGPAPKDEAPVAAPQATASAADTSEKARPERVLAPHVRVEETKEAYRVFADLPGAKRESIDVSVDHDELRLTALRELDSDSKTNVRYRQHFTLPERVQADAIEAHYDNGVLRLIVPKVTPQTVRIAVH
jgi:HSP20 family protein